MNIDFDFLYGDVLRGVDGTSPLLSSDSTTDLLPDDMNAEEELPRHLPADFNPDDFINDSLSDNSLFLDKSCCSESQIGRSSISPKTIQSWDSPQTSPRSSTGSDQFLLSNTVTVLPTFEVNNNPAIVAIHSGGVPLLNTISNGQGYVGHQQRVVSAEECLPLLNFCTVSNMSGQTEVDMPKFANNNRANVMKVSNRTIVDEKIFRKQQRMIRNRESASLSRKKKRDYVNSLETKISVLEKENLDLKSEVTSLRSQLSTITQTCNCNSRQFLTNNKNFGSQIKKNTAVLLAMVFMVSLNFGKFHSFFAPDVSFQRHKIVSSNSESNRTFTRKLLWINESLPMEEDVFGPQPNFNESISQMSRNYINQTENLRLTTELRKLAGVQKDSKSNPVNDEYGPVQFYDLKSRRYLNNILKEHDFTPEKKKYSRLFQKIHRKNDTFYILSFNSENILFPAALYNESSRPKMSLMLPTRDFLGNRKIAFMQIDCEVLNTSTIQLKDTFVPSNFRNHLKSGAPVESKSNITNNKDKHKFNPDAFPWKDYSKKDLYKPQFDGRSVDQNNKNVGVPDISSIYSLF